ncbi:HypC/HybG/HupF family hydrogenase formation chaperone [Bradyrhizobium sp.]|uniref:HypC/HybG/HupF family hydrogenase formation chaperone n=1 Tax=Bradyrhizobium sp. TaxID=376 RepID=UPI0039B83E8A
MARVDFGGIVRRVNLAFTPEARVGDHVLVHVGVVIATIDENARVFAAHLLIFPAKLYFGLRRR